MNPTPKIDVVYTWVDGECLEYQQLCRQYSSCQIDLNPERFRDRYSLLKYSLRSLKMYVPWINNIYILTCRPQVPQWLNCHHPKIFIVHHDLIIDKAYLPTFNCNVIESYLHKIPSNSDYLLYINDDFLFGKSTNPEDFITPDGKLKVLGTLGGEALKFRIYEQQNDIISFGFMEHTPYLIYKPYWQAMLNLCPEKIHRTRQQKFRTKQDIRMDKLYRYYLRSHQPQSTVVVPFYRLLRYHRFHKIMNRYSSQKHRLAKLAKMQPKFYCLNDDQKENPNLQVVELVQNFLETQYPQPSPFEV
ncbi:MAG: hypothetical protein SAJ12_10260 [Jaaginema sp. PMC 1079.18]|nr:hypothetical protein [Jaaginema sp. PMC 1080.18]MEC4851383.1 hypothetical protein [Jaaginema sp. PMC 1079.18]MEC4866422.1 hypothetical protein [Jaaginema sp. PMC 1078.18]